MQTPDSDALSEALKRCENEPIQFIGSVQCHGALLAIDALGIVQIVSDNLNEVLGIPAKQALKCLASQVLGAIAWNAISALTHSGSQSPPQSLQVQIQHGDTPLSCHIQVHWAGDFQVVELEIPTHSLHSYHFSNFGATDDMLGALLIAGKPLHEPIAQYGPFVMNTRDELMTAVEDFQAGRMG